MRLAILLALLVLPQAYADEPYPEHAGDLYPVEHWRLQVIRRPCDESCREAMLRTIPGFESYTRKSCVMKGIRKMQDAWDVPAFLEEAVNIVGFNCVFVYKDDS